MKDLNVMVSGLPGNMATLVATGIMRETDMWLCSVGLSHTKQEKIILNKDSHFSLSLVPEAGHCNAIREEEPDLIVDFSRGSAEKNCRMYCELGVPFAMGSTGGNISEMRSLVEKSNISAVIAPNMAAPVIVIQAMLEFAAQNFPGVFDGYSLNIAESHQAGKKDTSGTALALEKLFNSMGAVSDKDGILSVRDRLIQRRLCGIPPEYLGGHGHHEYVLESEDGTVHLALVHNIDGRQAYVDGTIKAIRFLAYKLGVQGKVYSMIDVLKNS